MPSRYEFVGLRSAAIATRPPLRDPDQESGSHRYLMPMPPCRRLNQRQESSAFGYSHDRSERLDGAQFRPLTRFLTPFRTKVPRLIRTPHPRRSKGSMGRGSRAPTRPQMQVRTLVEEEPQQRLPVCSVCRCQRSSSAKDDRAGGDVGAVLAGGDPERGEDPLPGPGEPHVVAEEIAARHRCVEHVEGRPS